MKSTNFNTYRQLYRSNKYLKVDQLLPYRAYNILARNARCGIWIPERQGFLISRWKCDTNYCFVELHWDLDPRFGTVKPFKLYDIPIRFDPASITGLDQYKSYSPTHRQVLNFLNALEQDLPETYYSDLLDISKNL